MKTDSKSRSPRPRTFARLMASGICLCLSGFVAIYLWSEFAQTFEGMFDSTETVVAAAPNGFPVDAPAVSVSRARDQETDAVKAAAAASELIFKDWNYTQTTSSPFSFTGTGGIDFFNPLFAFDFNSTQNQNSTLSSLLGSSIGTTPFGLSNSSSSTGGGTTSTSTSGGTTTLVTTLPTSSAGSGVDPTVTIPSLNGLTLNLNISISINLGGVTLGGEGSSHRHVGLNGITITITFQVVSPTT